MADILLNKPIAFLSGLECPSADGTVPWTLRVEADVLRHEVPVKTNHVEHFESFMRTSHSV